MLTILGLPSDRVLFSLPGSPDVCAAKGSSLKSILVGLFSQCPKEIGRWEGDPFFDMDLCIFFLLTFFKFTHTVKKED